MMHSIKTRLVLLLGLIMVIVCSGLGFISYLTSSKAVTSVAQEMLTKTVSESAKVVHDRMNGRLDIVEAFANTEKIADPNVSIKDKLVYLKSEAARIGFGSIGLADAYGDMVNTSGAKVNIKERPYFQEVMKGKRLVTDPFVSKTNGALVVIFAAPIKDKAGNVTGALLGQSDGNELSIITNDMVIGQTGRAFMLNKDATTIAHSDKNRVLKSYNAIEEAKKNPALATLAEIQKHMIAGEASFGEYVDEGTEKYVAYAPIKNNQWSLAIAVPKTEILSSLNFLRRSVLIASLMFLLLGLAVAYFAASYFANRLKAISSHLNLLSEGNFSAKRFTKNVKNKDEITLAFNSMQRMQESVSGMILAIKDTSDILGTEAESLSSVADEMSSTVENISTAIQESAKAVNSQAEDLSNITEIMDNFSDKLENIVTDIKAIVTNSTGINAMANKGNDNMKVLIDSVSLVGDSFKDFNTKISSLSQNINKVTEITNLINSIAEQTNMLSLNAAIEAARAGESGKGFAVVAEEIRKLAEQSKKSSQVINTMIKDISGDTDEIIETTDSLHNELSTQINAINTAIDAYKNIVEAISEIGGKIQSVNVSTTEINYEKSAIIDRVADASAVAQEVAASSQQISASADEMTSSSDEVATAALELNKMTKSMLEQVNKFKV